MSNSWVKGLNGQLVEWYVN